jgi:hypothetical protein
MTSAPPGSGGTLRRPYVNFIRPSPSSSVASPPRTRELRATSIVRVAVATWERTTGSSLCRVSDSALMRMSRIPAPASGGGSS